MIYLSASGLLGLLGATFIGSTLLPAIYRWYKTPPRKAVR